MKYFTQKRQKIVWRWILDKNLQLAFINKLSQFIYLSKEIDDFLVSPESIQELSFLDKEAHLGFVVAIWVVHRVVAVQNALKFPIWMDLDAQRLLNTQHLKQKWEVSALEFGYQHSVSCS